MDSNKDLGVLFVCEKTPSTHRSNWPYNIAYAGQIKGIRITGIIQIPKIVHLLLCLTDMVIRYPTSGIIQIAGILVKIANPKNTPEIKTTGRS
jgi:hypothetical protein